MPGEKTPLKGTGNGVADQVKAGAAGLGFSNLAREAMTNENLEQVSKVAADRVEEIRKSLMDGTTPVRVLALIGGVGVAFFAGTGILGSLLSFQWLSVVMEIYTFFFGLIMIVLESDFVSLPPKSMDTLYKYCLFLKFIWGRGVLYLITGNLQLAQGSIFDLIVGLYVMFVGILYIFLGRSAAKKLSDMKHSIFSEASLKSKFKKADKDKSGFVTNEEFHQLIKGLDLDMTKREMEGIFFHLDSNEDGKLSYEEFAAWWNGFDASASVV